MTGNKEKTVFIVYFYSFSVYILIKFNYREIERNWKQYL